MPKVLHLVPSLGICGAARQVSLLTPVMMKLGWRSHVVAVGRGDLLRPKFEDAQIPIHDLNVRSRLDLAPWLRLRRIVSAVQPDIVHAWNKFGVRWLWPLLRGSARSRLIEFDRSNDPPLCVAPCVSATEEVKRQMGIPLNSRLIACSGAIERGRGFREAVWVFDILRYVYSDLWLLAVGDGSLRGDIEAFGRSLGRDDHRIIWAGARTDAADLLGLAEIVWILGKRGGRNVALEAMAASRPVIARHRVDLQAILGDGETGALIPNADPHDVARATRRFLDDPAAWRAASNQCAARLPSHDVERIARMWIARYEGQ